MEAKNNPSNNKSIEKGGNEIKPIIDNKIEDPKQSNIQDKSKNDILKVLIYIYYYEKNILNVKKGINFNDKEKFYLIKSKWIKELKNYYEYQKISKSLDKIRLKTENKSNFLINLDNLSKNNLLEKIKLYINKNNANLLSKQPNENLKSNNINALPTLGHNKFIYYTTGYIINSTILDIFENYMFEGQKIKAKPKYIFNKENNIFLPYIDKNIFVTFGNLDNELIFHGISCLCYSNLKIFGIEKNILLNQSFKDYIISRRCQENDSNVQNLKKEINKKLDIIGKFSSINLAQLNSNIPVDKRALSSKPMERKNRIECNESYSTNNSSFKKSVQSLNKNNVGNNLNERSQTPKTIIKSQTTMNNNIQKKNLISLSTIQEESKIVQRNTNLNLQNKDKNTEDNNQNEQIKILQNELKKRNQIINKYKKEISKNKQFIDQLNGEKIKLMEKDKKNQEQMKILVSSRNEREKEVDEKNKNIIK